MNILGYNFSVTKQGPTIRERITTAKASATTAKQEAMTKARTKRADLYIKGAEVSAMIAARMLLKASEISDKRDV